MKKIEYNQSEECAHSPIKTRNTIGRFTKFIFWQTKMRESTIGESRCVHCGVRLSVPAACCHISLRILSLLCSVVIFGCTMMVIRSLSIFSFKGVGLAIILAVGWLAGIFVADRVILAAVFTFGKWKAETVEPQHEEIFERNENIAYKEERIKRRQLSISGLQICTAWIFALVGDIRIAYILLPLESIILIIKAIAFIIPKHRILFSVTSLTLQCHKPL